MVLISFVFPWWILLPCVCFYAMRYHAYEVVLVGVLLDVSHGMSFTLVPFPCVYTVIACVVLYVCEHIKPFMRFSLRR